VRVERLELASGNGQEARELARSIRALASPPAGVREAVAEIVEDVRLRGDQAVDEWTRRLDPNRTRPRYADELEVRGQLEGIEPEVRAALELAIANVQVTAQAELRETVQVDLPQGQRVELHEQPVRRAGIYAPAGRAAYPSTVVMCAVPARVAGVEQLIVMTQPGAGIAYETILAACALCEVDEVYFAGGAQAIAALAFGTETIEPVDVIVGPGNAYVQEAKRQVVGTVGIDGVEGPSELVVVADDDADPSLVALDLAAQGEHGPETLLVLATPSQSLLEAVEAEAATLSAERPSVTDAPLALVRTVSLETAVDLASEIAPEHLELAVADPDALLPLVRAAGCVFLGRNGGAAFGDYVAGSNHVLPTGGAARFAGPLGAATFRRRQALVSLPDSAVERLAPFVGALARAEGFPVHAASAEARSQSNPKRA
jgi:histidinol dehydrogenase